MIKQRTRAGSTTQRDSPRGRAAAARLPPSYGIDYVDSGSVHAAAARGTQGTGGPLPHLAAIQRAFGAHDVSGVRAYTGAAATEAAFSMGASAFAWGDKVGFAGKPSLRIAAHETAHVVQQRAGVQLKSAVGEVGDKYERQADAVAERVVRGESAESLLGPVASGGAAAPPAVQRSVGFEIELRQEDWNIWSPPAPGKTRNTPPPKGTPVIYGKDFTLQAEYGGEDKAIAELVTDDPGLQTRTQFEDSVHDMERLGQDLDAVPANTEDHSAAAFSGGDPAFRMDKNGNASIASAVLQVTVGVPLGSVPALFRNLEGVTAMPNTDDYRQARERAETVGGEGASPEFKGLMTLLHQYLSQLQGTTDVQSYVKGLVKVMARTDFHAMFGLMPEEEQTYVKEHMDTWIANMLSAAGTPSEEHEGETTPLPGGERLLSPIISDTGSTDPGMRITTTRERWLGSLPERDLFSHGGREDVFSEVEVSPKRSRKAIENEILATKKPSKKLLGEYAQVQSMDLQQRFGTLKKAKKPFWKKDRLKLQGQIESLYMGLGSLGGRMDFIEYEGEEAEEGAKVNQESYTGAPILEIRNPPNLGAVSNWFTVAERIYNAVDDAIKYPAGKGSDDAPVAPKNYRNVLTPKQVELQTKAKARAQALEERLAQLNEAME